MKYTWTIGNKQLYKKGFYNFMSCNLLGSDVNKWIKEIRREREYLERERYMDWQIY